MRFLENITKIMEIDPALRNESGIYVFIREENDFKYAYVGQSKHLVNRLAEHLGGYDSYIDLSIRKHKLYSETNPCGWRFKVFYFEESELNDKEREFMKKYANEGYQLRNKTAGGQNQGKFGISDNKPSKGYRDGIAKGYKNAQKFIKQLFDKNLTVQINGKPNKNKEKALVKFEEFINI